MAGQIYTQATNFVANYPPLFSQETGDALLGFIPAGKAVRAMPDIGRELVKIPYTILVPGLFRAARTSVRIWQGINLKSNRLVIC